MRASKIMAERALGNPKIEPVWNSAVREFLRDGDGEVRWVTVEALESGQMREVELKCVFVAIGHVPNTAPFKGKLNMDEEGYLVQMNGTHTNVPGVFAAGDVADKTYKQAVTAAGQGCAAALDAERYLANFE